ncbi:MAG TPA: PLP-dependent aminotransferase family protein [Rhodopila sp.]|uniref:MocR-like pyridoxine biosynthesis transcription factor PdxR n=1 Tax=Rhodopila sp. TaxID=2480087 RepID=UPI002C791B56|nr:PLP-dependent aminotransferase family protein [Rhodopila sp.]HVY15230.1 PLP-dependent aminotransferase family protein [Rhodopila sp.]
MRPGDAPGFLTLSPAAGSPLYRQIYARFRAAIADGVLAPGERVPAARGLAAELGLARGTVEAAYALLNAEGYFSTRGQAGTFVTTRLDPRVLSAGTAQGGPPRAGKPGEGRAEIRPFQMGLPALDAFPRKIWARLAARCVRGMQADEMLQRTEPSDALRRAIAGYLGISRGIECSAEQIFVTAGYRDMLALVIRTLIQPGETIWVEDPGYPPTRELLVHAGIESVPVPVDPEGLVVADGIRQAASSRAAIVTPAHQSPTCVTMSLPRRIELLHWAEQADAWIVEDDYDGEYRYVSQPLPALKSLDRAGRVLYAGSFSKVLFPGLRLGYLVVPEGLIDQFRQVSSIFGNGGANLVQDIVARFMTEGHFARHIQRMRRLYAERRRAVVAGLSAAFDGRLRIEPQPGGMHLVIRTGGAVSDQALARRMRDDGLYAHALTDWVVQAKVAPAVLISFTNVESEQAARRLGERIMALL